MVRNVESVEESGKSQRVGYSGGPRAIFFKEQGSIFDLNVDSFIVVLCYQGVGGDKVLNASDEKPGKDFVVRIRDMKVIEGWIFGLIE